MSRYTVELQKMIKNKIFKSSREKRLITLKIIAEGMIAEFLNISTEAGRGKIYSMYYKKITANLSIKNEDEFLLFTDKWKLREEDLSATKSH